MDEKKFYYYTTHKNNHHLMNAYLLLLDWKRKSFTFESKAKTNDKDS